MSYSNITVVTAQGTFGYQPSDPFVPISYNTLDLIQDIPHNAQLEVERIFSMDRNGDTNAIPNFLNDTNVAVVDKQRVFIIPTDRITYNITTKQIVDVLLPSSGEDVFDYTYTYISGPNAGQQGSIAVPQLRLGDNIIIRRKTVSNTPLVLWTAGSKLTTAQLNLNTTQLLYLVQELNNKITITSVSTEQILDNAITTPKILNGAVTSDKLFDLGGPKRLLGSGNVTANADGLYDVQEITLGNGFYWDENSTVLEVADIETGIKGDIDVIVPRTNWRIIDNAVTYAKMQNMTASRLLGRGATGAGVPQELTVDNNLTISGTQLGVTTPLTDGNKGDVAVSNNGTVFTLTANSVNTPEITDRAVTYAKMQNMNASNRLLGGTSSGVPVQEVQAQTDMIANLAVTNPKLGNSSVDADKLASNAVTTVKIIDNAVTYEKMRNVSTANRVLGSSSANGPVSEVQVNTDMLATNVVTFAKMQQVATNTLLGRSSAGTGNIQTISITEAGRNLIDENSVADMRQYLQLGTAALEPTSTFAPAVHTHGNISSLGRIGSTANLPLITGTNGEIQTSTFGTTNNTFCVGNDARLSDARTPVAHTHPISDVVNLQTSLNAKSNVGHGHVISDVANLQTSLDGKAASSHTHIISEVTNLQSALDGKAALSHTHSISEVTNLQTSLDGKAALSHTHTIANVTGLQTALDGKANTSHTHTISDVTNLQTALDAKANTTHTHLIADVTGLQTALDNKVDDSQISAFALTMLDDTTAAGVRTTLGLGTAATQNSTAFAAASHNHTLSNITDAGSAAAKNVPAIGVNATTTQVVMGDDTRLTNARTPVAHVHPISDVTGLQTALDNKLDDTQATAFGLSLLDDANAAAARTTLELGSAATQASSAFAAAVHTHTLANITDAGTAASRNVPVTGNAANNEVVLGSDTRLTEARTPAAHTHPISEVTNLQTALDAKLDDSQVTAFGLTILDDTNAIEVRSTLGLGSAAVEPASTFAQASHTHSISQVTGLQTALDNKLDDSQATAFGLSLLDDADNITARTTLGLGTAATEAASAFAAASHVHAATDITSGVLNIARIPTGNTSSTVVIGNDARLSDARTPLAHTHTLANITDAGTAAAKNVPAIGVNATASQVVMGDDSRLTNSRAPTSHTHAISDVTNLQAALDAKLDDSQATAFGLSLLDDVDNAAARTTLGLGSAATEAATSFAAASHTHAISNITDLQSSLDDKANSSHTHGAGDITSGTMAVARGGTGVTSTPTNGQLLIGNGSGYSLATLVAGSSNITITNGSGTITIDAATEAAEVSAILQPGTYGDIVVTSGGELNIVEGAVIASDLANDAVTFDKIQNIATDRLLGRATAGNGNVEEITLTAAGRALLDDADVAAQRETLQLGTAATQASTAFAAASHSHVIGDVTGLQAALDAKVDDSQITTYALTLLDDANASAARTTLGAAATSHTHAATDITSGTLDIGRIPLGTTSSTVVVGNDARLSDARTPTSHTHGNITNVGAIGSAANLPIITTTNGVLTTGSFGTTANTFCQGNDIRLSDARTPVAHTHAATDITSGTLDIARIPLGNTASTVVVGNDSRLSDARTPTAHIHGNISNTGAIGTAANLPIITTTNGVLTAGAFGTAANTFCQGNDARLSDARTPIAHTHAAGDITTGTFAIGRLPLGTTSSTVCVGNDARLSDARTPVAHTHTLSNITDAGSAASRNVPAVGVNATTTQVVMGDDTRLTNARTPVAHTHAIADVTGLQTALDAKVDDSQITTYALTLLDDANATTARTTLGLGTSSTLDVPSTGNATTGQVVKGDDTRLTNARTPVAHTHVIGDVTGLQAALDAKVDDSQISTFALTILDDTDAASVRSTLGLGSAATQASNAFAAASHSHVIGDVSNLQSSLDGKANTTHTHAISDVTNLQTTLDGKSNTGHTHAIADVTNLQTELNNKAALSHTHSIANVTGLQTALDGKAATSHTHAIANVTGLETALNGKLNTSAVSAFALTVLDDATAADARTTLGLGTAATQPSSAFATAAHTHDSSGYNNNSVTYGKIQKVATANRLLGSTTANADVAEVLVQTGMVNDSAITAAKLASDSVTTVKIANLNVTTAKLADGAVTSDKIANANVTFAKLPTIAANRLLGSVAGGNVGEVQIVAGMLADGLVTTAKIADGNVTAAKLASGVAAANLGNLGVTTALLADNAVTTVKITDLNVTTGKLANNAVTYGKMQVVATGNRLLGSTTAGGTVSEVQVATDMVLDSAITTAKVNNAAITADKLGTNSVVTAKILDRNVTFDKLPLSVTANRVLGATATNSSYSEVQVNTDMIANGAITAAKLAAGAVTISASDLADGSITAAKLGTDSVTEVKIQNGAVTNAKISNRAGNSVMGRAASTAGAVADITPTVSGQVLRYDGTNTGFGTVGTAGITDGAITTAKIGDAQVTGAKILDGTIGAGKLAANAVVWPKSVNVVVAPVTDITYTSPSESSAFNTILLRKQNNRVHVSGLDLTVTPTYTTSKILISFHPLMRVQRRQPGTSSWSDADYGCFVTRTVDGVETEIGGTQNTNAIYGERQLGGIGIVDTPNTTSPVTYTFYVVNTTSTWQTRVILSTAYRHPGLLQEMFA